MAEKKLYMLLLGCKPQGRNTEQHDILFGIAEKISDLVPDIISAWPEAKGKIHVDAWREVNKVDDFVVVIKERNDAQTNDPNSNKLFFINLGGYKKNEFDEFHYKVLVAAKDKSVAINKAKQTAFYKHFDFKGANSHIDDKYGIDVDDFYEIEEILPKKFAERYTIHLQPSINNEEDVMNLGYFKLDKL